MSEQKAVLTAAEAAAIVGTSPETIRRWVRERKLRPAPLAKLGMLRFNRAEIMRLCGERPERSHLAAHHQEASHDDAEEAGEAAGVGVS